MPGTNRKLNNEHLLHLLFDLSLWGKGLFAVIEILGGVGAFFVTREFLISTAWWLAQGEFSEDPRDFFANHLLHWAQNLSLGTQHFIAYYLIGHGVIKLWLITGLLREKLWYYPIALFVFAVFIAYQLYRFSATHSVWLLLMTAIDLMVIALTWHEFCYLSRKRRSAV